MSNANGILQSPPFSRSVGFAEITVEGDGEPLRKRVDVFDLYYRMVEQQKADGAGKYDHGASVVAWKATLKAEGIDVSAKVAHEIMVWLAEQVSLLSKKDPSPGISATPGSSDSPSGSTEPASTPPG